MRDEGDGDTVVRDECVRDEDDGDTVSTVAVRGLTVAVRSLHGRGPWRPPGNRGRVKLVANPKG